VLRFAAPSRRSAGDTSIGDDPVRSPCARFLPWRLSIRCSVSAAKPITSGGRLSFSFEIVARMSGFSTSCSGGMPA